MNSRKSRLAALTRGCGLAAILCGPASAHAEPIAITPQPMAAALKSVAKQTGVNIIFKSQAVRGLQARAIRGDYSPFEAVTRILDGSSLTSTVNSDGTILVRPRPVRLASATFVQNVPEAVADMQPSTQPSIASAEDVPQNLDIVVTAQRRSQRLQDVPIAVNAFTGEQLSASRTTGTQDLQYSVPSLVYSNNSGYAQPFLRGIGSDLVQPNADPSVATYIDGVYIASNLATITNLLGVERIEVLKGPQGTLYGRNAVGGAISIVTLRPPVVKIYTCGLLRSWINVGEQGETPATDHRPLILAQFEP